MDERLLINLIPGNTYLDKLTGTTKVRLFFTLIFLQIATWDIRILLPCLIISLIGYRSMRSKAKSVKSIVIFIILTNLFNLIVLWIISPDYGNSVCGGSTVLYSFSDKFIITAQTLWYLLVRLIKLMASFVTALVFIQTITPSELAAGLYYTFIPYRVCMMISLAFRYIPDISRDYENIQISMQARGLELDPRKTNIWNRLKQSILILLPLIISSFDRVSSIANAMDLRGFGKNKTRTYYSEHEAGQGDKHMKMLYLFLLVVLGFCIVKKIFFPGEFEVWYPFH